MNRGESSHTGLVSASGRDAALAWLLGRINFERTGVPYQERQLKLDRMRQLLARLGQPDAGMKIVHVAGTKGKGSTSAMIAAMLTAAGYRTGMFASPHLERIEERFLVDGQPCTADELVALIARVRAEVRVMDELAANEGDAAGGPTYFEITTAMALLHFVERAADAVVLEVGLGGRLDSTNVCHPAVSVVTSISFDHTKQLGNTLAAIAREKAGIIKPGVPVVCGVVDTEPQQVIADVAREHGCRLIQAGREFEFRYRTRSLGGGGDDSPRHPHPGPLPEGEGAELHLHRGFLNEAEEAQRRNSERNSGDPGANNPGGEVNSSVSPSPHLPVSLSSSTVDFEYLVAGQELRLENIRLAMRGAHQAANAAIALAAVAELRHQGWCISSDAMRLGLSGAVLPGRVEILSERPLIVLDTAHNPASARALVSALAELLPSDRNTLILSVSSDKDVPAIIRELLPPFDRILVTQYQDNPRAVAADKLASQVDAELARRAQNLGGNDRTEVVDRVGRTIGTTELVTCRTPREAWKLATQTAGPRDCIVIAGSFYLAAEMRPLVLETYAAETRPLMRL